MWKTLLIPVSPADMTMNRHPSSYHPRNCLPLNMLSEKTAQTSKMAPAIHDDEHQRLLTDVTHDDEHERLSRLLPGRRREMITIVPLLLVWPCAHITLRIGGVWLSCVSGILNCLWAFFTFGLFASIPVDNNSLLKANIQAWSLGFSYFSGLIINITFIDISSTLCGPSNKDAPQCVWMGTQGYMIVVLLAVVGVAFQTLKWFRIALKIDLMWRETEREKRKQVSESV